jgi:hypothetical protein
MGYTTFLVITVAKTLENVIQHLPWLSTSLSDYNIQADTSTLA